MKGPIKKIGIFEEAKEFNLKIWETPSFLFLVMGCLTIFIIYLTYEFTKRFEEPEIMVIGVAGVSITTLLIGCFFVNGISKMIIINRANVNFVSLAAHQLRTPLAGIKWSLRSLLDGDWGEMAPEQKTLLRKGYESNERIIVLVSDLLSVARIEAEQFAYDFSYKDIADVIKQIIIDLSYEAEREKVQVAFQEPPDQFPKVRMDATKIKLVLHTILDNAIRYNIPGGKVDISVARKSNRHIEIIIKDTGMGIPEYQMDKIFTRFFRGDNVVKAQKVIGTGLGLFLSKKIIERHEGKIWAESAENKGSTFHFTLPI